MRQTPSAHGIKHEAEGSQTTAEALFSSNAQLQHVHQSNRGAVDPYTSLAKSFHGKNTGSISVGNRQQKWRRLGATSAAQPCAF